MLPKDLLNDLEKGDRTNEHLFSKQEVAEQTQPADPFSMLNQLANGSQIRAEMTQAQRVWARPQNLYGMSAGMGFGTMYRSIDPMINTGRQSNDQNR